MIQREPCCWKWHSSSNHISISGSTTSRLSFFIFLLRYKVSVSNHWPGFTSAKPELTKQTLALTYSKINLLSFSQMMAKKLSVPKILLIPKFTGGTSQIFLKNITDFFCYCAWPARFIHVFEALKTALFKTAHPILDGTRAVFKKIGHFIATKTRTHQQNTMKTMIVPRFVRPKNLLLDCYLHYIRIFDFKFAHTHLLLLLV